MIPHSHFWRIVLVSIVLLILTPVVLGVDAGLTPESPWAGEVGSVPLWLQVWLMGILFPTFLASLFFLHRSWGARAAAIGFVVSHVPMMVPLFEVTVGVVGLMHLVCWSPAFYLLVHKQSIVDAKTPYGIWVHTMLFVLSVSLAFDFRDAMLYFVI